MGDNPYSLPLVLLLGSMSKGKQMVLISVIVNSYWFYLTQNENKHS